MLSDDLSKLSLELTKEGIVILGKVIESFFGIAKDGTKAIGKGAIFLGKNAVDSIKDNFKYGEIALKKIADYGEPLEQKDMHEILSDPEKRKIFDAYAKLNGFEYAITQVHTDTGELRLSIIFKQSDLIRVKDATVKTLQDILEKDAVSKALGKDVADDIDFSKVDILSDDEKDSIRSMVNKSFDNINKNNPKWDNEHVFEEAWVNSIFPDKPDIFKESFTVDIKSNNKEIFLYYTSKQIQNVYGKNGVDENFLHIPDVGIAYMDAESNLHYINLSDKSYASIKITDEKELSELRNAFSKTNDRLKSIGIALENKYSGYSQEKKDFLRSAMNQAMKNPDIDISILDNPSYTVEKMSALKWCMEDKVNINRLLEKDFSADQINTLRYAMVKGIDKDCMFDVNLSPEQMKEMIIEVAKNPMITDPELIKVAKTVSEYQKNTESVLFGGNVVRGEQSVNMQKDVSDRFMQIQLSKSDKILENHSIDLKDSLSDQIKFDKWWFVNKVPDHVDAAGVEWKMMSDFKDGKIFVNEQKEICVYVKDKMINPNTQEFLDAWNNAKISYTDSKGVQWKAFIDDNNGKKLVNNRGTAYIVNNRVYSSRDVINKANDKEQQLNISKSMNKNSRDRG